MRHAISKLKRHVACGFKRLPEGLQAALASALIVLKFVVPFYILSDILLYFDLLRPIGRLLSPLTTFLDLPLEAASALAAGILLNVYTAIAFAAPLELSSHQWTILGVFIGICHSLPVENAIMARLGISSLYSIGLRFFGGLLAVLPLTLLPASFKSGGEATGTGQGLAVQQFDSFAAMLLSSAGNALILSAQVIVLVCGLILLMDWIKSLPAIKKHVEGAGTAFSIIIGQILGITYGAGILLREAGRGSLSRRDIFFIGTFLMISHSSIEDVLLFTLFGANFWFILLVRLVAALVFSLVLLRLFKGPALDRVMRR
ncbi:MAG: nucleoside recognition protein [bacterium]|nr:nucleoside recognition protein [bacterium]